MYQKMLLRVILAIVERINRRLCILAIIGGLLLVNDHILLFQMMHILLSNRFIYITQQSPITDSGDSWANFTVIRINV